MSSVQIFSVLFKYWRSLLKKAITSPDVTDIEIATQTRSIINTEIYNVCHWLRSPAVGDKETDIKHGKKVI